MMTEDQTKALRELAESGHDLLPTVAYHEIITLRRVVKELATELQSSKAGQELLYRLKCQGVDIGVPFNHRNH